jgi:hypothetical protein
MIPYQNSLPENKYLRISIIIGFLFFIFISLASSCEGEKERNQFEKIDFSETEVILKKDSVDLFLIMQIPPNYKNPKTVIEITPYLIDCKDDSIAFNKIVMQGEEADNNFPIITHLIGGKIVSNSKRKIKENCKNFKFGVYAEFYHYRYPNNRFTKNYELKKIKK